MHGQPLAYRSFISLACAIALVVGTAVTTLAQDPVTFRVGITQAPLRAELNPFRTTSGTGYTLLTDRYDLLIEWGPELEPVAGLAESWEVSEDGLTWTYTMREGVTWQDGTPFTAEDARFTLQYIIDSHDPDYRGRQAPDGNANRRGRAANPLTLFDSYLDLTDGLRRSAVESVEAPDERTLVITTSEPLASLQAMYIPILPKHIWRDITFEEAQGRIGIEQAIGTGPFRIVEFDPRQAVVLERHEGHWGGTPNVERLVYQFFDNDEAQVASLVNGEVDFLNNVPPSLVSALEGAEGVSLNVAESADFAELGFNSWDPTPERFEDEGCADCPRGPTTGSLGDPWLTLHEVRASLAGLIDKPQLIEFAQGGYGVPGVTIVAPRDPLYAWEPEPDHPGTFPAYASPDERDAARTAATDRFQERMAELGFEDTDGNGILNVPATEDAMAFDPEGAGGDWSLRLFVREDDEEDKLAGQLIEVWFEMAGVDVAYEETSEDPRFYEFTYPSSSNADMDLYIWGWEPDPDPDFQLSTLTCSQINGWQDANYCDDGYDALYDQQHTSVDREERAAIIRQMLEQQYSDAPYAVLWYVSYIEAYRSDEWEGFQPIPADGGLYWTALGFGPYGSRVTVAPAGSS